MPNREQFVMRYDLTMQAGSDRAEIMVYGQIVSYKWNEKGPEVTATDFDKMLKEAREKGAKKLHIRINSPGGSVWQAVAMRTMLLTSDFEEITVAVEGICASAATLLCCLSGVKTTISEGSEFMIHNPSTIALGTAADFRKEADRLEKMEGDFRKIYADHSGQSEDDIKDMMDEEKWMTAKEAVEYGFCASVLEGAQPAACVTEEQMAAMRSMYRNIPQMNVHQTDTPTVSNTDEGSTTSTVTENTSTQEEEHNMEIKDITMQQLQAENPGLLNEAIMAERQRVQDIDDLTLPGYEQMAADAKRNGTSAMDFQKQIVKAQREKGPAFMANRQKETEPAANVKGSEPGNNAKTDEDELKAYVEEMKKYAMEARDSDGGMH